MMNCKIY